MANLSEQEIIRREKLEKIRELGINPYPADLYPVTHLSEQIKSNFIENWSTKISSVIYTLLRTYFYESPIKEIPQTRHMVRRRT